MSQYEYGPKFRKPQPLTSDELNEIQAGRRGDPHIRELLVEIKRLHEKLVKCDIARESVCSIWKMEMGRLPPAILELQTLLAEETPVQAYREKNPEPLDPPALM